MSYQVLARKWRPRRFSELVGQEHVVRALSNALDGNRLHHAYLFTGTRGVGKTTIARIFAKSLNCERGQSADPCGECAVCTAVDAGRFVDLLEIDAASNTGVDDVREMIENAQYAPARGRYKVYLIDEVHMLSKAAFNALLKTLEEPPPHVKFLLATTDPEKLLVTVLSRCLKFNLKRLLPQQMIEQMRMILQAEKVSFDDAALIDIAHAADGSMRDALSLLDQSIAYGDGALRADETRSMLGTIDHGGVLALLQALADRDGGALLAESERIAGYSPDFIGVLDQISTTLHRIQMLQLVPDHDADHVASTAELKHLGDQLGAEEVQLYYQMSTHGRRDLHLAPNAQSGFEMVLLRMLAFRPSDGNDAPVPKRPRAAAAPVGRSVHAPAPVANPAPNPAPKPASPSAQRVAEAAPMPPAAPTQDSADWDGLIEQAALGGMVGQLARHTVLSKVEGCNWTLALKPVHADLAVEPMISHLQDQLTAVCGKQVKLRFVTDEDIGETPADRVAQARSARHVDAERAIRDDPLVRRFEAELGAQIVPQSIRPLEN